MAQKSEELDKWRKVFGSSKNNIFDVIENAILVAASDFPKEFKLNRDKIAETLYSCKSIKCTDCDHVKSSVVDGNCTVEGCKSGLQILGGETGNGVSKESKANSSGVDNVNEANIVNVKQVSNFTNYKEAEALSDLIEQENETFREVLRLKETLLNSENEFESALMESLRRLQLMNLSVNMLEATGIGMAVNPLKRHSSKQIRVLARALIDFWKNMVVDYLDATDAVKGAADTPESVKPNAAKLDTKLVKLKASVVVRKEEEEEEKKGGLLSPPLEEGAFFMNGHTCLDLSGFFDCMDEDGNLRQSFELKDNSENGPKPSIDNQNARFNNDEGKLVKKEEQAMKKQADEAILQPKHANTERGHKDSGEYQIKPKNTENGHKPVITEEHRHKPTIVKHGIGKQLGTLGENIDRNVKSETKLKKKLKNASTLKNPIAFHEDKPKGLSEEAKFEAAKRRLQENYLAAQKAKKQRSIQIMEIEGLSKLGLLPKKAKIAKSTPSKHTTHGRR